MENKMQSFEDWERERSLIVTDIEPDLLAKEMSADTFDATIVGYQPHGVNWNDRIKFLQDNGYKLTRENMHADLSARPTEENQQ